MLIYIYIITLRKSCFISRRALATDIERVLLKIRNNNETEFGHIFKDVLKICNDWEIHISLSLRADGRSNKLNRNILAFQLSSRLYNFSLTKF